MLNPRSAAATHVDEYRLVRRLSSAEDGGVFLAHDRILDRAVVLRILPHATAAAATLLSGARALARVSHPSLSRVHRIRESGTHPCVVQGFERGELLDTLATPLPTREVIDIGRALAGALAALHTAGVAHGEVRADRVVVSSPGAPHLFGLNRANATATADALARDVTDLLALLQRFADHDLRESFVRLGIDGKALTAEELHYELNRLAHPSGIREILTSNPYRGLRPFEPADASLFFGRQGEVAEALARLRSEPWLLVAGPSGAGKSSFVRAGVVPAIVGGALEERPRWDVATLVPGTRPLSALATALAPIFDRNPNDLETEMRTAPGLPGRLARARADVGLLLFVDQLEETLTLSEVTERDAFFAALSRFRALAPGVRTIMTLRRDFLDCLAGLDALGRDLLRATFLLPPMGADALRQAIVGPARARGFEMETAAMVDALVAEAQTDEGADALPLLSFVLAELWSERDRERRVVPHATLARLGGTAAALARHGDTVFASLAVDERREARRILLALVTASETRIRRTRVELVGEGGVSAEAALEALIRGRLVVAGETHEIAHEALVRAWPRLRAWLDEASEARMIAARLAAATLEWVRLGRGAEGLGSEQLLGDLAIRGALEGAKDDARAFVDASRAASRQARARRLARVVAIPVLLAFLVTIGWTVSRVRHRAAVARAVSRARALYAGAEEIAREASDARAEAIARFEKDDLAPAGKAWKRTLALEEDTDRQRRNVGVALDNALALDPRDKGARALYADLTLARLRAAERLHEEGLLRELRAQLDVYDDGSRATLLRAPAHVRALTEPPDATLTLARYREDTTGRLVEANAAPLVSGLARELEPGSYLIVAQASGRYTTRYPFLVRPGDERTLRLVLPPAASVPEDMILYVPAGRTLYGSSDDEAIGGVLLAEPVHDVEVGAFLIARTEVTNADYLAFLEALPKTERAERMPRGLQLLKDERIVWKWRPRAGLSDRPVLFPGELYCNGVQPCVDWSRLPLEGASREDGEHFVAWLASSARVLGARLCTDREWERAARGADDRRYPNGNADLEPTDACTLAIYAGASTNAGPCPGASYPASRSLFGVDDMVGSEYEWVSGFADAAQPKVGIVRSASWNDSGVYLSIANRGLVSASGRFAGYGLRVCADAR